jgi:hypothetical protein
VVCPARARASEQIHGAGVHCEIVSTGGADPEPELSSSSAATASLDPSADRLSDTPNLFGRFDVRLLRPHVGQRAREDIDGAAFQGPITTGTVQVVELPSSPMLRRQRGIVTRQSEFAFTLSKYAIT